MLQLEDFRSEGGILRSLDLTHYQRVIDTDRHAAYEYDRARQKYYLKYTGWPKKCIQLLNALRL